MDHWAVSMMLAALFAVCMHFFTLPRDEVNKKEEVLYANCLHTFSHHERIKCICRYKE